MAADLDTVISAYDDNASYDTDDSLTEAKAFRTACRQLLRYPEVQHGSSLIRHSNAEIRRALAEVQQWISSNADSGFGQRAVRHISFEEFRT